MRGSRHLQIFKVGNDPRSDGGTGPRWSPLLTLAWRRPSLSFGAMHRSSPTTVIALVLLAACSAEPPAALQIALGAPESSALSFQAVDAGTGAALTDSRMTVRYLVRAPITLDASAVEVVSSGEPYRVSHDVAEENLVLEVRLESDSYHRLDTVLSVPRGGSGGPFTLRMSRKLGGQTAAATRPADATSRPTSQPAASQPTPPLASSAAAIDRSALVAGNQAYGRGDWAAATEAYERMQEPNDRSSAYAEEYTQALVQRGMAHLDRGEMGGALEALEEAMTYPEPGYKAYVHGAQAQCAVGRADEGRGTLAILSREVNRMPPGDRPMINALKLYYEGMCNEGDFDRTEAVTARVSAGASAIRAYDEFIEAAAGVSPVTPELRTALDDAEARKAGIRQRIRG
jgi:tetratricopeptide (TPR) repeat protein